MIRKQIWDVFIKTGNIEAYLFENRYCKMISNIEQEFNSNKKALIGNDR